MMIVPNLLTKAHEPEFGQAGDQPADPGGFRDCEAVVLDISIIYISESTRLILSNDFHALLVVEAVTVLVDGDQLVPPGVPGSRIARVRPV